MYVPRPQSSVVLLDPARFATILAEHRRIAGFPLTGLRGEPMGLRAFARELGVSAPALLEQLAGSRRHLRVKTLTGIWRLQRKFFQWTQSDDRRQRIEALLLEGHPFTDCCVALGGREQFAVEFEHALHVWSMEDEIVNAIESLEGCARESWVLPQDTGWPVLWEERPKSPQAGRRRFRSTQLIKEWVRLVREMCAAEQRRAATKR